MMGMGEIGITMGGEGGSRWRGETCNSSKPCRVPEEMEAREFLVDISYCLTLVTRILKIYSKDANINTYIYIYIYK